MKASLIVRNIGQLLTLNPEYGDGRLGIIHEGAIAFENGRVAWIGHDRELRFFMSGRDVKDFIDAEGKVLLPGLIDPHTHLIFGGSRENEFSMRLEGRSYQEILASGGGILSTVRATRSASTEELLTLGIERLREALSFGVTTIEVKSGYGLNFTDEIRLLRVIRELNHSQNVQVVPTFLGAHALPPEFIDRRKEYIKLLVDELIPVVASEGLAEFCDVFCETGAFTLDEAEAILEAGLMAGLKPKIHTEQFTRSGGVRLAIHLGATSCDHLEKIDERSIELMSGYRKPVAVLLPGTSFFLKEAYAPARKLLDRGIKVALGTNFNPGSSPTQNLPFIGTLACLEMGMTCEETVEAITINAASAIDRENELGSLEVGKRGDAVLIDAHDFRSLFVNFGHKLVSVVIKDGAVVYKKDESLSQ